MSGVLNKYKSILLSKYGYLYTARFLTDSCDLFTNILQVWITRPEAIVGNFLYSST